MTQPRAPENHRETNRHDHDPRASANLESTISDGPVAAKEITRFDSPVSIAVTSYRVTLADADGISAKAIIDGIVHRGILHDDAPEFVTEVSFRQVKVQHYSEEKTIVTIVEV